MKIGLIVAMQKEFDRVVGFLNDTETYKYCGFEFILGKVGKNTVVLHKCGIGKVNAAIGTTLLIKEFSPNCIISTGVAGGLSKELNVNDVVIASYTTYHDVYCGQEDPNQITGQPRFFESNNEILTKAYLPNCVIQTYLGVIATGDIFVDTKEKAQEIKDKVPIAMAVDMESAAIAHVCHEMKTPFLSVRTISDLPLTDGSLKQYEGFWDEISESSFLFTKILLGNL